MIFLKFKLFNISYMKLQKLIKIKKGQQLNKEFLYKKNEKDINLFPVINGGKEPSGWWWKSNFDKNLITISQGGASCGYVQWQHTKFWAGAHCYVIMIIHNKLNYKFIYYFLKNKEKLLMKNQKGAGIPSLDTKTIYNLEISIPPIEVQNKIVEILDKFTNYKAQLTAELTFRKEQYKYYRNILMNKYINKNLFATTLSKVTLINKFKQPQANELEKMIDINGNIALLPSSRNYNWFTTLNKAKKWLSNGNVIALGRARNPNIKKCEGYFVSSNNIIIQSFDEKILSHKYLYYFLDNIKESFYVESASYPKFDRNIFDQTKIFVPPIEIQNKIVEILDKFSFLINNISDGIPKEIELRKKQYEYYRNLLLTFKDE